MMTIEGIGCGSCGLGEHTIDQFKCYYYGNLYFCEPRTAAVKSAVVAMQKAVDGFLNVVNLYKTPDFPLGQNPIGSSKSSYDGIVGPNTSKLAAWAATVAAEMHREAGEGDPAAPIIIDIRLISEKDLTEHASIYAVEIADYLNESTSRINDLVAAIKAKQPKDATSIFVAPPPLPVPSEIRAAVPPAPSKFSTGKLIFGGTVAAAALGALGAVLMRGDKKDKGGYVPPMPMMGAHRRWR